MEPPRRRRPIRRRTLPVAGSQGSWSRAWPALAVLALLLSTAAILLLNQRHSGDPVKVRRELRKF